MKEKHKKRERQREIEKVIGIDSQSNGKMYQ